MKPKYVVIDEICWEGDTSRQVKLFKKKEDALVYINHRGVQEVAQLEKQGQVVVEEDLIHNKELERECSYVMRYELGLFEIWSYGEYLYDHVRLELFKVEYERI